MKIPRIAQPLFRQSDTSVLLIGLIRSVDTVPVAARDVFRVVVRDVANRQMLRFDLSQENYNGICWIVPADITGEIL
jgi:hypothetical protein